MKYTYFPKILPTIMLMAILVFNQACGTEELGNKDTMQRDKDNDPTSTIFDNLLSDSLSNINNTDGNRSSSSEDGVSIELTNFGDQEWLQLKLSLNLEDAPEDQSLHQLGEELALGPWEVSENNRYQLIYFYGGQGNLRLRLRLDDDNNSSSSVADARFLTKQEAENLQLSSAWVKMERTARRLEDSLSTQTQQNAARREEPNNN